MKQPSRLPRFLLVGLLGLLAGVAVVKLNKSTRASTHAAVVASASSTTAASADAATSAKPKAPDIAAPKDTAPAPRPFSTSVSEALPKLEQPVKNWREYKPEKIVIAPYPDTPMEFEQVSVREENGRTVWNGRNKLTGAFLVTVATENEWHAVLEIPTADSFEMSVSGQIVSVVQTSSAGACGTEQLMSREKASGDVDGPAVAADSNGVVAQAAISTSVDVIYFYDAATLAANTSYGSMVSLVMARVDAANLVLANSAVTNFQWRYVAMYPMPAYTTTPTDIATDLNYISNIAQSITAVSDNTLRQFVLDKMNLHGADQAVFYITGTRATSGNTVGLAWSPTAVGNNISTGAARAVVMWKRTSDDYVSSELTMAHELAHNFACQHDRVTAAKTDTTVVDNDGRYWYGYTLTYNNAPYGTVMSYLGTRIPYFSNPTVSYNGVATGLAVTDPKAAYNAKVLTDKSAGMASLRALAVPAITTQPQSVTVDLGASFSFSVVAQGAITSYQWQKNGAPISSMANATATSATYTVASATATDADSYNVVITNPAGPTTSNTVTATVNGTSSSSSSSSSSSGSTTPASGGGGGGGGALNLWALVVLGLVAVARLRQRC